MNSGQSDLTTKRRQAGKRGGLATLAKHGHAHMAKIGRKGASVTWQRYHLSPVGTSDFAMVRKDTGEVIAFLSGVRWPRDASEA